MAKYCSNCGSELKEEQDVCLNCGVKVNKNDNTNNSNNGLMQKRDVVT